MDRPEQLRLAGTEVPHVPFRLSQATIALGRTEVQRCREILAEVTPEGPTEVR